MLSRDQRTDKCKGRRSARRTGKGRRYRCRAIVLVDVVDVHEYMRLVEERRVEPPISCPDGCSGGWAPHDTFKREWVDYDCVVYSLVIVRVRCRGCQAAWSLFPAMVWYRFRYCHRLVQSSCSKMLESCPQRQAFGSAVAVSAGLRARLSPIAEERVRHRVPGESVIRSWMRWLGQSHLEGLLRSTLSMIATRCAEAARALLPAFEIRPGLPPVARTRERVRLFLQTAAVLDGVMSRRENFFRSAPNQLRDLGRILFRERRLILARPP